jgi:hypothetical protein
VSRKFFLSTNPAAEKVVAPGDANSAHAVFDPVIFAALRLPLPSDTILRLAIRRAFIAEKLAAAKIHGSCQGKVRKSP